MRRLVIAIPAALLVPAMLAGCDSGGGQTTTPASPPASTRAGAPTPAATTPDPAASVLPAGALLQPVDVNGASLDKIADGDHRHLRPLRPCDDGAGQYPSDSTRQSAVAVQVLLPSARNKDVLDAVVVHYVARHEPGAAAAVLDDVRAAVRRCPGGLGKGERRWRITDEGIAGDESILVTLESMSTGLTGEDPPQLIREYAALARVGDVVVVVAEVTWEGEGVGDDTTVRELIGKAVQRAATVG